MDATANPAVQIQDMPSSSQTAAKPEELWTDIKHTVSKVTRKSGEVGFPPHCEKDAETRPQVIPGQNSEPDEEAAISIDPEDSFPEGGLRAWLVVASAWLVVASAWLLLLPCLGFMVSIGTLQDYWLAHQLSSFSARDVGWIPSIFVYLSLGLGIWVGPLFDRYGPRWIALIGSIGYTINLFLLAECKTFWQMMLCCGILGGVSGAMLMTTSLAAVSHWFKVRRGLTQGIAMTGSSCGGLMIPMILRTTLPKYGYAWSMRILGIISVVCFVAGNILIKARIPPTAAAKKKAIISLSIFGDLRFSLFTISVFGFEVVLFGALGILPTYASLSTDFGPDTGFYLIAILNGVSCFGRILPGYVADKIGRFNTLLVMILFTWFFMLILWLPLGNKSLPALYCFAAVFGFGTGSWMALVPACIGQLCQTEEFGRYYGSMYFIASLATLVCVPISGELVQTVGPQPMVAFFCAVLGLSFLSFVLSRWACLGRRWVIMEKV